MSIKQTIGWARMIAVVTAMLSVLAWSSGSAAAAPAAVGAVYTQTNAASGNAVVAFARARDGALTPVGTFPTGGRGTGSGLGSQGALALSADHHWLLAVNAGSNEVSVFTIKRNQLQLASRAPSGGVMPISMTIHDDLVYVLNAGGSANITGFTLDDGQLTPLDNSTQPLSHANAGPAEVQFSPDGALLVVTEKAANTIDTFVVDDDGIAQAAQPHASAGITPFGFAFDRRGRIVVSEAAGGAAGAGSVSSYRTSDDGGLNVASGAVANQQSAPCWVIVTRNGRTAYVANTGSGTISGYRIASDGQISLLDATGAVGQTGAGSKPADLALSRGNHYLYVLNGGNGTIGAFGIMRSGSLRAADGATGLPAGAAGLVAY